MRYIPADKLIAEIERLKPRLRKIGGKDVLVTTDSVYKKLNRIIDFARSLQQEPRFPQYDNIVDKVFGAGNLEGFEYREAEMLVALAKEELMKSIQQEQPEVDLAEELTRFFSKNPIPHEHITDWPLLKNTALYFYELGLNARKE